VYDVLIFYERDYTPEMMNQNDKMRGDGRFALILTTPILPGRTEAWRRFVQEMSELRRHEYEASRRHLGIVSEWWWLVEGARRETAVIAVIASHPERIWAEMVVSERPFDLWYRQQLVHLLGVELPTVPPVELIWSWPRRC
jgi:hypothetical protein